MDGRDNNFGIDFAPIGQAIKKARIAQNMTREQLAGIWSLLSPTSSPNSSSERPFGKLVANGDAFSFGGLPACRFIASSRIL